jgi:spermidine synthase
LWRSGVLTHFPCSFFLFLVGGGEGATLREVLKHKTVESVTMIEIDQELIDLVQEYMPELSNCADLVGRADNCFDDEVTNLVVQDGTLYKSLRGSGKSR